jgi:hypothetical protein
LNVSEAALKGSHMVCMWSKIAVGGIGEGSVCVHEIFNAEVVSPVCLVSLRRKAMSQDGRYRCGDHATDDGYDQRHARRAS